MKSTFLYLVAAAATLLACLLWLVVLDGSRGSSVVDDPAPAIPASALTVVTRAPSLGVPAAPERGQTACVDGAFWFYKPGSQQWVKPQPVLRCDVRTGAMLPASASVVRRAIGR